MHCIGVSEHARECSSRWLTDDGGSGVTRELARWLFGQHRTVVGSKRKIAESGRKREEFLSFELSCSDRNEGEDIEVGEGNIHGECRRERERERGFLVCMCGWTEVRERE